MVCRGEFVSDYCRTFTDQTIYSSYSGLYGTTNATVPHHAMDSSFENDCFVPATQHHRKSEEIDSEDDDEPVVVVSSDEEEVEPNT